MPSPRRCARGGFESTRSGSFRWKSKKGIIVDFLIPATNSADKAHCVEVADGFYAMTTPGLHLAYRDWDEVKIKRARRPVRVCGPGAYIVLKSLAFRDTAAPKHAFDLWYVLTGRDDAVDRYCGLTDDDTARLSLRALYEDFGSAQRRGPVEAARFLFGREKAATQSSVAEAVRFLLDATGIAESEC